MNKKRFEKLLDKYETKEKIAEALGIKKRRYNQMIQADYMTSTMKILTDLLLEEGK